MSQTPTLGKFSTKPSKSGLSWQVVVEGDHDRMQYIGGFESEQAARDWINNQACEWPGYHPVGNL